jgi:hypothetical protein
MRSDRVRSVESPTIVHGAVRRNLSTILLVSLLAVVLAGCGAVNHMAITPSSPHWSGDVALGATYFNTKTKSGYACASCHTLAADTQAVGTIGPNLDFAFGPDRCQGFHQSTIQDVVLGQIYYADPDPEADWPPVPMKINGTMVQPAQVQGMPANLWSGAKAQDIASYVAAVAGLTHGPGKYFDCTTGAYAG